MPPSVVNPRLDPLLTSMLEEVRRLDPYLDLRPGSSVRTILEAAAQSTIGQVETWQETYAKNLRASVHDSRPDAFLRARLPRRRELLANATPRPNDGRCGLTRGFLQRAREEIERVVAVPRFIWSSMAGVRSPTGTGWTDDAVDGMPNFRPDRFLLDEQTYRDIVGGPFPPRRELSTRPSPRDVYTRSSPNDSIQAEEDRQIFMALDAATARDASLIVGTWAAQSSSRNEHAAFEQEYLSAFLPAPEPGWMMQELPGVTEIHPRAIEQLRNAPVMPIHAMPTVRIDDIQNRRFGALMPRASGPNPCGEVLLGPMNLEQMKKIALVVRHTAWQKILQVEELDYE